MGQGWTNTEIAERLVLTESTVKKHVGRVLAKIGARDRIQAVITAYDTGLVRPKPWPVPAPGLPPAGPRPRS
nr:LuxR C-terminal-related transcriptional regulator [Streptomyces ossamyceticus]